jgi:hypothetical protein
MVHAGAQSAKSDPIFIGTGMLTRGGERDEAHIPQIDWQGFTRRVDRNTERQWINNLEVAEDLPGAVAEFAQMIVRDGGVVFASLLRHTDIYVTTAEIPKRVIESAPISTPA